MAISIESILSQLKKVKKSGNGWIACCPAHNDQHPSLKISPSNDGKVLLHCKAGCTVEQICKALGISVKDLFPANPKQTTQTKHILTLEELAQAKAIPVEFLKKLGVSQAQSGVIIPYYDIDETPQRQRKRTALIAKEGSLWERKGKIIPYGLWLLEEKDIIGLPDNGILIVEGESDVWTARLNGFQALGIPGAQMTNILQLEHIQKFPTVYIAKESDQGGEVFLQGMTARLRQIGYPGKVKVILMPGNGIKDINDLWRKEPEDVKFWNAILELADKAKEINFRQAIPATTLEQTEIVITTAKKPEPVIKTLDVLLATEFPPTEWVVEGILPQGLTLIAGRPKMGKSAFILGIALAVAYGGIALQKIPVQQGDVLFLALEGGEPQLQTRVRQILIEGGHTEHFNYATQWPPLENGGLEALEKWLQEHPQARLVVIDTFAKVKSPQNLRKSIYDQDYQSMEGLNKLAQKYRVAIVLIHHTRKGESADFLEDVSGSFGLTANVDTIAVLKRERGKMDAVLHITGRQVEEQEIALKLKFPCWELLGDAQEFRMSKERQAIITTLKEIGKPASPKEIYENLQISGKDCTQHSIQLLLGLMVKSGEIKSPERGKYSL